ncbi:MAG: TIGR00282 family metallophosphoesterase [Verrucomicrobia bacterium]|nr:TIGR00282 family metallophosphoesterase [Verrucomicrobiota bacterium]
MKILVVGDIVGSPGRTIFARIATRMKQAGEVDCVVANAENAAGGRGITPALADELFAAGADVLTMGDHTWDQKDLADYIISEPRLIRPANFPSVCPGKGFVTVETDKGPVSVINLIGRVFMPPNDCPFRKADAVLSHGVEGSKVILVDMHAEATSENIAMGRYLEGRVSAVFGTHTHVQTSDETILPKGTAYITDLGMTGPKDSVLGRDVEAVLHKFVTGMPTRFDVASGDVRLEGIILEIDENTGKATSITRIREA